MKLEELEKLQDIFYKHSPYDYTIAFRDYKPKTLLGFCHRETKIIVIYKPDTYWRGLLTVLHEIAHARTSGGHTLTWEKELVYLLKQNEFPRDTLKSFHFPMGPALREYIS
jgi:hypothetical protein